MDCQVLSGISEQKTHTIALRGDKYGLQNTIWVRNRENIPHGNRASCTCFGVGSVAWFDHSGPSVFRIRNPVPCAIFGSWAGIGMGTISSCNVGCAGCRGGVVSCSGGLVCSDALRTLKYGSADVRCWCLRFCFLQETQDGQQQQ